MTSLEALDDLESWVEYLTRLDYVDPIPRGEMKQFLYDAYHKTLPHFDIIRDSLKKEIPLETVEDGYEGIPFCCPKCGAGIVEGALYCYCCGQRLVIPSYCYDAIHH